MWHAAAGGRRRSGELRTARGLFVQDFARAGLATATARRHVDREQAYWLEHRDYPDIFRTELEAAIRILTFLPGVGSLYSQTPVVGLRRVYLEKV